LSSFDFGLFFDLIIVSKVMLHFFDSLELTKNHYIT